MAPPPPKKVPSPSPKKGAPPLKRAVSTRARAPPKSPATRASSANPNPPPPKNLVTGGDVVFASKDTVIHSNGKKIPVAKGAKIRLNPMHEVTLFFVLLFPLLFPHSLFFPHRNPLPTTPRRRRWR